MKAVIAAVVALLTTTTSVLAYGTGPATPACRCFPGDACWPSLKQWSAFNSTVGGRLIATVPLARPCHGPAFNNATCSQLQNGWFSPTTHMASSSSVMAPFFANQSCDPFTGKDAQCIIGTYVQYAVNVSTAADVVATVLFARNNNIRLVIRNTGHDYLGRSTGAGALAIWTHYMKDMHFDMEYFDLFYQGPAARVGAGVQGFEIAKAARDRGLVVVGGECPTVGIAGGYTQGGGHSALSTSFGLSADNVLEWEVVTADGSIVVANRWQNQDLYWALSGGGAGNYAVVLSMTVKAHPDAKVGGAMLVFSPSEVNTPDKFFAAVDAFHVALPKMIDAGAMVVYYYASFFFQINTLTAYGKSAAEVDAMLAPFRAELAKIGIAYFNATTEFTNYYDHYDHYFGPLPYGAERQVGIGQYGSRLIPRSVVEKNVTALNSVARYIVTTYPGTLYIGISLDVSQTPKGANAVNPAWRDAMIHTVVSTPYQFGADKWSQNIALQGAMTEDIIPRLTAISPSSGAYTNEGDFRQKDFKNQFFGENYEDLLEVKNSWDPYGIFYATKAVGSDAWVERNDGRLCRA